MTGRPAVTLWQATRTSRAASGPTQLSRPGGNGRTREREQTLRVCAGATE
ncbi:hypothetical protein [Haladaptatus sp. NG-WS-4]